ncbi:hypothetical protein SAMN05428977_101132 [Nitrosomonas sp. Nm166]|nr:hypothetical protein SAMN05428977_101132 [Nitrosomonas sp. Nm166]
MQSDWYMSTKGGMNRSEQPWNRASKIVYTAETLRKWCDNQRLTHYLFTL